MKDQVQVIAEYVKEAFCVEGDTEVVFAKGAVLPSDAALVKCTDKDRGVFYVTWMDEATFLNAQKGNQ